VVSKAAKVLFACPLFLYCMARSAKGYVMIVHEDPGVNGGLCLNGDIPHVERGTLFQNIISRLIGIKSAFLPISSTSDTVV
jgi:hypothetical protein